MSRLSFARPATWAITVAAVLATSLPAVAAPQYKVEFLRAESPYGGDYPNSGTVALSINDAGMVAGSAGAGGMNSAFTWQDGQFSWLAPRTQEWKANSINNQGTVVGSTRVGSTESAVVWQNNTAQVVAQGSNAWLGSINNAGTAVGSMKASPSDHTQAIIWQNNSLSTLPSIAGATNSYATGINDAGVVIGLSFVPGTTVAWIWQDGQTQPLTLDGATLTNVTAINNQGDIVGARSGQFVLWRQGQSTLLESLPGNGAAAPYALNEKGQVVGESYGTVDDLGIPWARATLWENGQAYNLNDLVVNSLEGGTLQYAFDINEKGQITGRAAFGTDYRGFVLTPVPEADALLMLGLGMPLVLALRARRRA